MKKLIALLITVVFVTGAFAQKKFEGKAIYMSKTSLDMSRFGDRMNRMSEQQKAQMMARMKNFLEKTYTLNFNQKESMFREEVALEAPGGNSRGFRWGGMSGQGTIYKNVQDKNMIEDVEMIVASTSTIYGSGPLEYLLGDLEKHFSGKNEILFIPYARPSGITYDEYAERVSVPFSKIGKKVVGIHSFKNPKTAIRNAEAIFTGGGNTFELVNQLYKNEVLLDLKNIIEEGIPYLGTSAGSNICGVTMKTTNDMPIVYPPSFKTLGLLSFNINAHYLDPIKGSTHMGETRETRIKEFHQYNVTPVLGLREGSWLDVKGNTITLKGPHSARLFRRNESPIELETNTILDF